MDAVLSEEQVAIVEAARDLAAGGLAAARAMLDGADAPEQPTATLFEGYTGLGIEEAAGGAGGTLVDLALVVRALGRTVCPTAWLPHQLALQAAAAAGLDLTEGMDPAARWVLVDLDHAGYGPDGGLLVRHGVGATMAVVLDGEDVELRALGPATPRRAMDPSRPVAEMGLGPRQAAVAGRGGEGRLRARAIIAASLVGTGLGAVERAASYATQREQFGKPIGIFQGVSHQLAQAWTGVELAWSLVLYACWSVGEGQADAARAVDAAAAKASTASVAAAEAGMQVHGGIGITWEADPHLALRRAMADEAWVGGARGAELSLGRALLGG